MKATKVLLIEPPVPALDTWGSFRRSKGVVPPIGLLCIYAYLKEKGVDVTFFDSQSERDPKTKIIGMLRVRKYDIIGIPVFTNTANHSFALARLCKDNLPDSVIVFGNVHTSALPKRTLEECPSADICVMGEGELTVEEIVNRHDENGRIQDLDAIKGIAFRENGRIKINEARPFIESLDDLPNIYKHYEVGKYVPAPNQYRKLPSVPFITQRGCPFSCSFCEATLVHGRKTRFKSVERVVEELSYLKEKYGIRSVYFQDSTFTVNKKYTLALCEQMQARAFNIEWSCSSRNDTVDLEILRAMKAAGCWQICYGVESGNQQSLEVLQKGGRNTVELIEKTIAETKETGISVLASFILGVPGEDERMVMNTIQFAKKLAPHTALFFLPVPYPGTKLYETCRQSGGLREDAEWQDYLAIDFSNPVYVNPLLGKKNMKYLYRRAFRSFYFSPNTWWTNLKSIRSWSEVRRYLRAGNALLGFFRDGLHF